MCHIATLCTEHGFRCPLSPLCVHVCAHMYVCPCVCVCARVHMCVCTCMRVHEGPDRAGAGVQVPCAAGPVSRSAPRFGLGLIFPFQFLLVCPEPARPARLGPVNLWHQVCAEKGPHGSSGPPISPVLPPSARRGSLGHEGQGFLARGPQERACPGRAVFPGCGSGRPPPPPHCASGCREGQVRGLWADVEQPLKVQSTGSGPQRPRREIQLWGLPPRTLLTPSLGPPQPRGGCSACCPDLRCFIEGNSFGRPQGLQGDPPLSE